MSKSLTSRNKPNDFSNEMTPPLEFSVPYEVALTHIIYQPCKQGRRFFQTGENLVTLTWQPTLISGVTTAKKTEGFNLFFAFLKQEISKSGMNIKPKLSFGIQEESEQTGTMLEMLGLGANFEEEDSEGDEDLEMFFSLKNDTGYDLRLDENLSRIVGLKSGTIPKNSEFIGKTPIDSAFFAGIPLNTEFTIESITDFDRKIVQVKEPEVYNVDDFLKAVNDALVSHGIALDSKSTANHVVFKSEKDVTLDFGIVFQKVFGVSHIRLKADEAQRYIPTRHVHHKEPYILVNSNLVDYTRFGDASVPILKILPPTSDEELKLLEFNHPEYHPVRNNRYDRIHVALVDDELNEINLKNFPVDLILKFRPASWIEKFTIKSNSDSNLSQSLLRSSTKSMDTKSFSNQIGYGYFTTDERTIPLAQQKSASTPKSKSKLRSKNGAEKKTTKFQAQVGHGKKRNVEVRRTVKKNTSTGSKNIKTKTAKKQVKNGKSRGK